LDEEAPLVAEAVFFSSFRRKPESSVFDSKAGGLRIVPWCELLNRALGGKLERRAGRAGGVGAVRADGDDVVADALEERELVRVLAGARAEPQVFDLALALLRGDANHFLDVAPALVVLCVERVAADHLRIGAVHPHLAFEIDD